MKYNRKETKTFTDIIRERLILTIIILLFIRIGSFFPIPGINHRHLAFYIQYHVFAKRLVSTISGDNTVVIGLFTLNIIPYINASILLQAIIGGKLFPSLTRLQKEGGASSRRIIDILTRVITVLASIIQSIILVNSLKPILFNWNLGLAVEIIIWLTTGALIVLWLSQFITDFGLGNGTSLLIATNIISNFPNLYKTIVDSNNGYLNWGSKLIIILLVFILLYGIILLQESVRRVPLVSYKELNQNQIASRYLSKSKNYLPLGLNQTGVMPIIFTTTILLIPNYLARLEILTFFNLQENYLGILSMITNLPLIGELIKIVSKFIISFSSLFYWLFYFILIIRISLFYSAFVLKPKDISEQLQKMAVTIPGIRPGKETTLYLKNKIKFNTIIGSLLLAILATLPTLVQFIFNISSLSGLSTTSLLIVAGVLLDLLREIASIYYSTIYNIMYK